MNWDTYDSAAKKFSAGTHYHGGSIDMNGTIYSQGGSLGGPAKVLMFVMDGKSFTHLAGKAYTVNVDTHYTHTPYSKFDPYEVVPSMPAGMGVDMDIMVKGLIPYGAGKGVGYTEQLAHGGDVKSVTELLVQKIVAYLPQVFHANPSLTEDVKKAVTNALKE